MRVSGHEVSVNADYLPPEVFKTAPVFCPMPQSSRMHAGTRLTKISFIIDDHSNPGFITTVPLH